MSEVMDFGAGQSLSYVYESWEDVEKHLGDIKPLDVRSIRRIVGGSFDDFWWWRGRYRVVMGSRSSKKSMTTAFWYLLKMMEMPLANVLVVRRVADSNRNSTFARFIKCIHMLGVQDLWSWSTAPLEIRYKPTGQKIIFSGLDDPYKLSSVDATYGVLCWCWFEEAYQIPSEDLFDKVDQSIRGIMPPGYFPQITLTFNPWNQNHWLKKRFFDNPDAETLAKRVTYLDNEFCSEADLRFFERMKERDPRMYQVAGLGNWGVSEGLIYNDWEVEEFDIEEIKKRPSVRLIWGLDFGFSNDPCALIASAVDTQTRTIYVYDEWLALRQSNRMIAEYIKDKGWDRERIVCDSASPQAIYELSYEHGINAVGAVKKGGSVNFGIQLVQQYRQVIHPRCENYITEIGVYCYAQDKMGNTLDTPIDDYNHCLVAGTKVLTMRGDVPIEDVRVGEEVLTHRGWRRVTASGITRPTPQRIWRMTLSDGTVLEGTEDHPIQTNGGMVRMKRCKGLYVAKWGAVTPTEISICSVLVHVASRDVLMNIRRGMKSREGFYASTARGINWGYGLVKVESVECTDRYEYVYDLTVDDAHDFFANGILVGNCMDAQRYALSDMISYDGGGFYGEVKGNEDLSDPSKQEEVEERMKGTRYVYST